MTSPLQNRITPFGDIAAISARGLFTGNRGVLHDPDSRTLHPARRWTSKAWIICTLDFRGRRRDVMGRNGPAGSPGWTALFFLDEATALAAGHRPCFYCRRSAAKAFQAAWTGGEGTAKAPEIDAVLHAERLDGRAKRMHPLPGPVGSLPDGAFVTDGQTAFLVLDGQMHEWSFSGYRKVSPPAGLCLLTPPSTLRALASGYRPVLHESAFA